MSAMASTQPKPRGWSFMPGKPVVRGYDSSPLFREDCVERIKHLHREVEADMRELARMKREYAATEKRLKRMKKERGWID